MVNKERTTGRREFRSSVNIVLAIVVNITVVFIIYMGINDALIDRWVVFMIYFLISMFMISFFYFTKYIVEGESMYVMYGVFKFKPIPIKDWVSIKKADL